MKILAFFDDIEYAHLLESCLGQEDASVEMVCFDSVEALEQVLSSGDEELSLLIVDAYSGGLDVMNRHPHRSVLLTSPKYDRELELYATSIGAAGYFPRIQDSDVVSYIIEQMKQMSFVSSIVH
jgi:hypothetical protein